MPAQFFTWFLPHVRAGRYHPVTRLLPVGCRGLPRFTHCYITLPVGHLLLPRLRLLLRLRCARYVLAVRCLDRTFTHVTFDFVSRDYTVADYTLGVVAFGYVTLHLIVYALRLLLFTHLLLTILRCVFACTVALRTRARLQLLQLLLRAVCTLDYYRLHVDYTVPLRVCCVCG